MTEVEHKKAESGQRVKNTPPPGATAFAYGSLLPLAIGLVIIAAGGVGGFSADDAATGFLSYAALLLCFFAGARFGHALRVTGASVAATATALPVGIALLSLFLPDAVASGLLAVAFAGLGAWDVWSADRAQLTAWYGRLRFRTTPIAVLALIGGVFLLT